MLAGEAEGALVLLRGALAGQFVFLTDHENTDQGEQGGGEEDSAQEKQVVSFDDNHESVPVVVRL